MKAILIKYDFWGYVSGKIEKGSDGALLIATWEEKDEKAFFRDHFRCE